MQNALFMEKILYFTQRYRPHWEGTSKEIEVLLGKYSSQSVLHNLHFNKLTDLYFSRKKWSYHFVLYPFLFLGIYLYSFNKIKHIYTHLTDLPYLPFLHSRKIILTSTNYFTREEIRKRKKYLQHAAKIVIEAEIQRNELLDCDIDNEKILTISPSVDLGAFSYTKAKGTFKILDVSCPYKAQDLQRRGISLLLAVDTLLQDTEVTLSWRDYEEDIFTFFIPEKLRAIRIQKGMISSMNEEYGNHHCTIIPYTRFDSRLKLIPNSVMESLAAGKPVLVSSQTGIAPLIEKEKCGVVFEPRPADLLKAIGELKKKYGSYQKKCRATAEKYFSQQRFLQEYEKIYQEVIA